MTSDFSTLRRLRVAILATLAALTMAAAGCAAEDSGSGSGADGPIRIGLVNSETGAYVTHAASYTDGFEAGLDYATDGTGEVDGHKIEVIKKNDNGDQATGLNAANELLGDGVKMILGPTNSAIAIAMAETTVENGATFISGPSGSPELVGMDKNVFPSWAGTIGLNAGVMANLGDDPEGKTMVFISQDYAYGQGSYAILQEAGEPLGVTVESVLLPADTRDFTGGMLKAQSFDPDIVYVAWEGPGASQLFNAMGEQDLYETSQVISVLPSQSSFGPFAESAGASLPTVILSSPYFEGAAGGNDAETAMIEHAEGTGVPVDYAHPVGFAAAQMVVHAIEEAGPDLAQEAVAEALSGWSFDGPVGDLTIREEDHLVMQPQYSFTLEEVDGEWKPTMLDEFSAETLMPPVTKTLE